MEVNSKEYYAAHHWARTWLEKLNRCFYCEATDKATQWSNIDHKYRRIPEEWQEVCGKCHTNFDVVMNNKQLGRKRLEDVSRDSKGRVKRYTSKDRLRVEGYAWFVGW